MRRLVRSYVRTTLVSMPKDSPAEDGRRVPAERTKAATQPSSRQHSHVRIPALGVQTGRRFAFNRLSSSLARARLAPASSAPCAFARRIAVPAINRAIPTRLKRNGGRLATTRTNHRSSLRRSRTVAGSSLVGLLCLAARLTALWCRVTAFLKELLIGRTEGKLLPTVAACNLHISGHMTPCVGLYSPICIFFARILFDRAKNDIDLDLKSALPGQKGP